MNSCTRLFDRRDDCGAASCIYCRPGRSCEGARGIPSLWAENLERLNKLGGEQASCGMTGGLFVVLLAVQAYASLGAEVVPYRAPLTHLASIRSVNCPVACYCSATTWNCDGANLTSLPQGYPKTIMYLNFHNNKIPNIPSSVFRDLPLLRSIDLRNNSLKTVKFRAFSDLPVLHTIFLSYNQIETIEVGAFQGMDKLKILRLDHNRIPALFKNTFTGLPALEEIRLRDNPTLSYVEPGTFYALPELREIQMYRTLTNTTLLGTYDTGRAVSQTTFAPDCPKLGYIELGTFKMYALYPNFFHSNNFLEMVRRIGQGYETWSTDIEECTLMSKAAVFGDVYGASLCMVQPAARLTDSPSRREKSHLEGGGRLLRDSESFKTETLTAGSKVPMTYSEWDDEGSRKQAEILRQEGGIADPNEVFEIDYGHESMIYD